MWSSELGSVSLKAAYGRLFASFGVPALWFANWSCAPTASHFVNFFLFDVFSPNSLIINRHVGSPTSHRFSKLRTCPPACRQAGRCASRMLSGQAWEVTTFHNACYFAPFFFNFNTSYTHAGKQAKGSFMIVRFGGNDRKLFGGWSQRKPNKTSMPIRILAAAMT